MSLAALNDGYIQTLDQYVEYLPNFTQFLSENPDIDKSIRTDNGELYAAPWLRQEGTDIETGLVVRKDWLDQLGMEVPTTVDEMHEVLTAFKTELGIVSPMTFELRWLWLETAAASPLCLYEWENQLHKGDNLILSAFGAGFTWGTIYLKWIT